MNKKQAIKECKELWSEIKASGLSKVDFLRSAQGKAWVGRKYLFNCPLCELTKNRNCEGACPLHTQYGDGCFDLGFDGYSPCPPEWFEAIEGLK